MKNRLSHITAFAILFLVWSGALPGLDTQEETTYSPEGYLLRIDEGEILRGGLTVLKASPAAGTEGSVLGLSMDRSAPIHAHDHGDEILYVISGKGQATVGEEQYDIQTGDVVFVPTGTMHSFWSTTSEPMMILFYMDRPGLEEYFRALHHGRPIGDEFDRIVRRGP